MVMRGLLLITTVLATACGLEPTARQRQEIYGGTFAPADDAVFFLELSADNDAGTTCSAALIAPRTLLTAAHCVDPAVFRAQRVRVLATNAPVADGGTFVAIDTVRLHPGWNAARLENDLALLLLPEASAATPLAWRTQNLVHRAGLEVRAIGYGRTEDGTVGVRQAARVRVQEVTPGTLRIGDLIETGICFGDSGGPSLLDDELVGIHSAARSSACNDGFDARVDVAAPFIRAWLAQFEDACLPNGLCAETACLTPDPDCLALGAPCVDEQACPSRACTTDAQHPAPYCSRPCTDAGECGPLSCDPRVGRCQFPQLPEAGPLERCVPGQTFCAQGTQCVNERCERLCTTDADCGGMTCETGASGLKRCAGAPGTLPRLGVVKLPAAGCSTGSGFLTLVALLLFRRRRLD